MPLVSCAVDLARSCEGRFPLALLASTDLTSKGGVGEVERFRLLPFVLGDRGVGGDGECGGSSPFVGFCSSTDEFVWGEAVDVDVDIGLCAISVGELSV